MCGIAGLFGRADRDAVAAMLQAMAHRGPDDRGLYVDAAATLGHLRLAIIDVSRAGHQPMTNANNTVWIVFNGEIYNFREERRLLEDRGIKFASGSDTEVILALYDAYGEDFVARLRGIFALAIYDRRDGPGHEKLILARDHFGIKPLLYAERAGVLAFASELKGLLASGLVEREIDPAALRQLLSLGSVYQPQTLVSGVTALPPGHIMVCDRRRTRLSPYWRIEPDRVAGLRRLPYAEQVERLRAALIETVRLQMVGDVPVGAFLSGGVDSSLIVALMAREAGGRVKTFSVGFEEDAGAADESGEAAEVACYLATEHSRVLIGQREVAAHLDRFVAGLDQPSVDGLNSYFVSEAAARAVTVSLSGTGGDDLFLGYPWFAQIARRFGETAAASPPNGVTRWWQRLRGRSAPNFADGAFCEAFGRLYHCFGPAAADDVLAPAMRERAPLRSFGEDYARSDALPRADPPDRAAALCVGGYTRNQLLRDIDACSMVHSLEVRVPFLDPVVADHAFSLPVAAKLRCGSNTLNPLASYDESGVKRIVCDVARAYLPAGFFVQRSKKGFGLPMADWLRGSLAETLGDALSASTVAAGGLFDPPAAAAVRDRFVRGELPWSHPWLLMVTELWRRDVLSAPPRVAPVAGRGSVLEV
jgi:asparagine synthase (glutamine-hydrolysing)